jgi:peptidoglycan/xylan/chitin deacetylase (PgdA/CDA1 family)
LSARAFLEPVRETHGRPTGRDGLRGGTVEWARPPLLQQTLRRLETGSPAGGSRTSKPIIRFSECPQVASLLRNTGILRALELLRRAPGLLVLNYHRVGDLAGNHFDDATFSATAEAFRAQVAYMKRWFLMPPPDEILESLSHGSFKDPTVLVTFDDGYRDNHEIAFPVLRDLGVPACFFMVTGLLDAPRLPWWDRVAYSVKRTNAEVFGLEYPERLQFDLRTTARAHVTWRILRACKDARPFNESRFFDELAARTGVGIEAERLGRTLFMSWDAVREMAQAGMTIGSHTTRHAVLASLSEAAQRRELGGSRDRLGEALGSYPDMVAYPVGGTDAFTAVTKRLAREVGYRAAFSYGGGLNRPSRIDRFAIGRVPVDHAETWAQFRVRLTLATIR